jgi:hypothetical protein
MRIRDRSFMFLIGLFAALSLLALIFMDSPMMVAQTDLILPRLPFNTQRLGSGAGDGEEWEVEGGGGGDAAPAAGGGDGGGGDLEPPSATSSSKEEKKKSSTMAYLMQHAQGTAGGKECEDDYGMELIRRWQRQAKDYCVPHNDGGGGGGGGDGDDGDGDDGGAFRLHTHVRCQSLVPSHQTPEPQSVCLIRRVVVDFGRLRVALCTGEGCHKDFYDHDKTLFFEQGTMRGSCRQLVSAKDGWNAKNLVKTAGFWLIRGWENIDHASQEVRKIETETCTEENTVNHFVYFVSRYDVTNLYHATEDLLFAFITFSVLEVPYENSQVIIADGLQHGPYLDVWKELYSRNHPLLFIHDLHQAKQVNCYKRMSSNVFSAVSPLCKQVGMETHCANSTLIRGFREFFLASLSMKYLLPKEDTLVITVIQRKDYTVGNRQKTVKRQIKNHNDLIALIEQQLPHAEVRSVDFASLTYREQLKIIRSTDILLGAHGAALSHMILLPTTSVTIEFWIDDRHGNYHYVNMAKWLGTDFILEKQTNPLDLSKTKKSIIKAAEMVTKNKKKQRSDH